VRFRLEAENKASGIQRVRKFRLLVVAFGRAAERLNGAETIAISAV
jgi:hypothetical protein